MNARELIDRLERSHYLEKNEYIWLLSDNLMPDEAIYLSKRARSVTDSIFGRNVRIRGLIECTNICRNNCYYCGLRQGNQKLERYAMSPDMILDCCRLGHKLGFRTFVLQGGENPALSAQDIAQIVSLIHREFDDSAITLSLGEWPDEDLSLFKQAGATRYLLRHETVNPLHYSRLHPPMMSLDNRLRCLQTLKRLGFQTGTGIMVGSPFQTLDNIAEDLVFMSELQPEMIGIGPFIPHADTPFANQKAGSVELTLRLISILRLMFPHANIPSTTALASLGVDGRKLGLLAGANVVMPNLTQDIYRKQYSLYNNKAAFGAESAEGLDILARELADVDLYITTEKGDYSNV